MSIFVTKALTEKIRSIDYQLKPGQESGFWCLQIRQKSRDKQSAVDCTIAYFCRLSRLKLVAYSISNSDITLLVIITDRGCMYIKFDNRKLQRVNLSGPIVLFVDSGSYYKGKLKDVSYDGFRVDFPSINLLSLFWPDLTLFFRSAIWRFRKFRIVICTNIPRHDDNTGNLPSQTGKSFFVSAYPRWIKKKKDRLEIGFKIPKSSVHWQYFVHQEIFEKK